jgi:hypothetical protein
MPSWPSKHDSEDATSKAEHFEILIFGSGAGGAAVQMTMLANLPYTKLRDAILAHPTMAEGLGSLFTNVPS